MCIGNVNYFHKTILCKVLAVLKFLNMASK